MDNFRITIICILVLIRLISLSAQRIIYSYIKRKSPGMKTVFDEMIQDLILGGIAASLTSDVAHCGFGPLNLNTAIFIVFVQRFTAQFWFMQIFITFLVRYLCIFHAEVINSVLDKAILAASRLCCFFWAFSTSVYDFTHHDFSKLQHVNYMLHEDEVSEVNNNVSQVSLQCIIIVDLIFIAFVLLRIELYKWNFPGGELAVSKGTIRITIGIFVIIGIAVIIRLSLPLSLQDTALLFHVVVTSILFVVIPILVIVRNEKMKSFAVTHVKQSNAVSPCPI